MPSNIGFLNTNLPPSVTVTPDNTAAFDSILNTLNNQMQDPFSNLEVFHPGARGIGPLRLVGAGSPQAAAPGSASHSAVGLGELVILAVIALLIFEVL